LQYISHLIYFTFFWTFCGKLKIKIIYIFLNGQIPIHGSSR
jgi:hypothetical protein